MLIMLGEQKEKWFVKKKLHELVLNHACGDNINLNTDKKKKEKRKTDTRDW